MSLFDLVLIAVSLSMDAFAVSICKGLSVHKVQFRHALICGIWFGGFQAGMPALGYFLGDRFSALLTRFGPWIAFLLLAFIGANMVKESFGEDETLDDDYSAKAMLPLAVATSIDAFAVGVGFAAMQVQILPAVALIGCITCCSPALGSKWVPFSETNTAPPRGANRRHCSDSDRLENTAQWLGYFLTHKRKGTE